MEKLFSKIKPQLLVVLLFGLSLPSAFAVESGKIAEQKAGIVQRISKEVSSKLIFTNEAGETKNLADFNPKGLPIVIAPVYFECPRLCSLTQEGLLNTIADSDLELGKDYLVFSISFNDKEGPTQSQPRADKYRNLLTEKLNTEVDLSSWKFLTGSPENVTTLMQEIGFKYEWDEGEYMHAAGIVFITPNWVISRYLFGISFPERDFDLALVEASQGKIGDLITQALLYCFRYDHIKGQYTLAIWKIIRIVCGAISVFVIVFVLLLRRREKRTHKVQ